MVEGFNDFLRPEFCKIEVLAQHKYDVLLEEDLKTRKALIKHHLNDHHHSLSFQQEGLKEEKGMKPKMKKTLSQLMGYESDIERRLYAGNADTGQSPS